jgi:hypothetical protein
MPGPAPDIHVLSGAENQDMDGRNTCGMTASNANHRSAWLSTKTHTANVLIHRRKFEAL